MMFIRVLDVFSSLAGPASEGRRARLKCDGQGGADRTPRSRLGQNSIRHRISAIKGTGLCFNERMPRRWTRELNPLLKQVSRSFYLTLRVLPGAIRPQMGLAYLLARTADSIADTRLVPVEQRLSVLRELRAAIDAAADGRPAGAPDLGKLADAQPAPAVQASPAERVLIESAGKALGMLREFHLEDRQRICRVLRIITRGQELDLVRFGQAAAENPVALESDADLEEYIYCVAGCVGEFWTRMCRAHLFARAPLDDSFLMAAGVRFGKGLQLVNILRDLPQDLRQGRCYIPLLRLAERDLEPRCLLEPSSMPCFRPIYDKYLDEAEDHLAAGWAYTNALPYGQMRLRLACAWPLLIGVKTIALLRSSNVLDSGERLKVSRSEITRLVWRSALLYPFPLVWNRLFDSSRG